MKKARIMLFSVFVLVVISTNLALKTNRFSGNVFYEYGVSTTIVGGPSVTGCVVPITLFSTTTVVGGTVVSWTSSTTFLTRTCSACTVRLTAAPIE
jgi:hypothetical protein